MRIEHGWVQGFGVLVVALVFGCGAVGCGDSDNRPPQDDGGVGDASRDDAGPDSALPDAGADAEIDATVPDAGEDAAMPDATMDAGEDAGEDAAFSDAGEDAAIDTDVTYGKGSGTGPDSELGRSLALGGNNGDTLVIGSPGEAGGGAVYVFVRDDVEGWSEQARLVSSNRDGMDRFGGSVGIDGDTIVVGAVGERSNATGVNGDADNNTLANAGAAYVFTRNGETWTQQAYIKASNTDAGDNFGYAVAISGDSIAVGAQGEDSNGVDGANNTASFAGAAYVFTRSGSDWSQQAYIKASNPGQFDRFGIALDIDGDTLAVGAYYEDGASAGINGDQSSNAAPESGAVYVFTRSGSDWSQQAYVKASNVGEDDWFGGSVALEGNRLVVGARYEDGVPGDSSRDAAEDSGAAYVFTRSGSTWSEQAYLKPSVNDAGDAFGIMVVIHDGVIAVGAMEEDSAGTFPDADPLDNSAENSGAVYVFTDAGGSYAQTRYIKASNTGSEDRFGAAIALSATQLVVGAFSERGTGDSANNEGAFYIYNL